MCIGATQKRPVILSINIQSLQSKYEQLCLEINELVAKNIEIDAIVLQETWNIQYPELLDIDGFKPLIFKKRRGMRGGGVGIYIKNNLSASVLENFSPFENKIMESITIQLSCPGNNSDILLTSVYRSNGPIPNKTQTQQMDRFMEMFATLLSDLKNTNLQSLVFTDSNINLLQLGSSDASNFMNCLFTNGYLQCISKATRFQNNIATLIDQILLNSRELEIYSGTLISDVSDHLFTFVMPHSSTSNKKQVHKTNLSRDFSNANLTNFRNELGMTDWNSVLNIDNVDESYEEFWRIYTDIYNRNFTLKRMRFNKNIHKVNNFMTAGLLVSRESKKFFIKNRCPSPLPKIFLNTKILKQCILVSFVLQKSFTLCQNWKQMLVTLKRFCKP
jgi:exonuclease III